MFLLVGGLGGLLLLNTLLAQGSFAVHDLDTQITALSDRQQSLQQKVAELAAPQRLARQANQLGMVATVNPAFLQMPGGHVLGKPTVASEPAPPPTAVVPPDQSAEPSGPTENGDTNKNGDTTKNGGSAGSGNESGENNAGNTSAGNTSAGNTSAADKQDNANKQDKGAGSDDKPA
ncbi:MAG: hypothetical protein ABI586_00650 [Candidatus Nanopelagicales bacterium]